MPRGTIIIYKSMRVLSRGLTTNSNGEEVEAYTPGDYVNVHVQPISTAAMEYAQLSGIKVDMQAFIKPAIHLYPDTNRIRDDTTDYHVRDAKVWPLHTELLLERVVEP